MAITFRHDAAGVVPPSNASTRKYGQSLVLQQQQQKYAAQQAGYDRMFDAYKMESQNIAQQQRDWQQRDFVLNRDRDQNKLQQQQQRAADFSAARARMDTYAKDSLNNPDLPPQLRQQIQNLVSGKMVAMGSGFNETQQQQFLDQYNAELAKLLSEVPAPKPQPTASDRFNQRKHFDEESGQWFIENSKGDFVPVVDPRQQQQQEKLQQQQLQQQEQEAEKMRPKSMEEYYSDNEDKFQKDLDSTMSSMQKDYDLDPTKPAPTRESALKKMQEDYDFRQQALGKPQYGEPTLAKPYGQALGDAKRGAQNKEKGAQSSYDNLADMNDKLRALENRANSFPKGSKEAKEAWSVYHTERDRIINGGAQPAPEMRSILEQPGQQPPAQSSSPSAPTPAAPTPTPPPTPQPTQDWNALAAGQGLVDMGPAGTAPATPNPTGQPTPAAQKASQQGDASNYPWLRQPGQLMQGNQAGASQPAPKASSGKASTVPNFGELASARPKQEDQELIIKLEKVYDGQSPQVQSAIGAYLDPKSTDAQFIGAKRYLKENGIDVDKLLTPKTEAEKYVLSQAKKHAKSKK